MLMGLMVSSPSSFADCGGAAITVPPNTVGAIEIQGQWCATTPGYYFNAGPDVFNGCQVTFQSTQTSGGTNTNTSSTAASLGISTTGITYNSPTTTTTTTTTSNTSTTIEYHVCTVPPGYATNIPSGQGALRKGNSLVNMGPTAWGNIALGKPTGQSST